MTAPAEDRPYRILLVCTGNVCRSPMAERLLRAGLDGATPGGGQVVDVASTGTRALVGRPMTPQTAMLVRAYGGDPDGHAARQLAAADVAGADLVLGLTRSHRSAAVQLHPPALRRTFTLREVARSVRAVQATQRSGEGLATLADALRSARGRAGAVDPELDDVVDPYGRSDSTYEASARQLVPAVEALVHLVATRLDVRP